ncbi:putative ATP-dependent endonuclease of OLD family, partial [Roseovarius sp. MBR-78]|uniref:ATP-dependent nuclease n=1 Tax=Roseovarius sp. MBR-78 TaxID=3156460 RepID=UPI00339449F6
MYLKKIAIRNFRRLKDVSIDFEENETVFVGPNNSGKTSATASIRSFLSNRDFKIHDFSLCSLTTINGAPRKIALTPAFRYDRSDKTGWGATMAQMGFF